MVHLKDIMLDRLATILLWVWDVNNITRISTLVIAMFTIVLAATSWRQARLMRRSIDLTLEEFRSTHRPKIVVHAIETARDFGASNQEIVGASIIYFNVGDTRAEITAIKASITRVRFPLASGTGLGIGVEFAALSRPHEPISAGQFEYVAVFSAFTFESERFAQCQRRADNRDGGLICLGRIEYRDERGVCRQTGFCWRFDIDRERWVRMEDRPEYDYAY